MGLKLGLLDSFKMGFTLGLKIKLKERCWNELGTSWGWNMDGTQKEETDGKVLRRDLGR